MTFRPRAVPASYEKLVKDVLGPTGRRTPDPLAVMWAHQIAWRQAPNGDEAQALRATAERYGLDWRDMVAEQARQVPAVVPALVPAARTNRTA